jgi:hypothetical protein
MQIALVARVKKERTAPDLSAIGNFARRGALKPAFEEDGSRRGDDTATLFALRPLADAFRPFARS